MKKLVLATVLAAAALAGSHPAARAQSIGVSYNSGQANAFLATTDSAGATGYAQTNFNNVATLSATALKDSLGVTTTLGATLSGAGATVARALNSNLSGPDEHFMNGQAYSNTNGLTLSLSNIPYSSYSLVVYCLNPRGDTPTSLTLGSTTRWVSPVQIVTSAGYLDNNPNTPFTYIASTSSTQAGAPTNSDYTVFTGLSGAGQSLFLQGLDDGTGDFVTGFEGFQIINTGPGAVAPEPSTWAAVAAGAGLLGMTTLRRRRARAV